MPLRPQAVKRLDPIRSRAKALDQLEISLSGLVALSNVACDIDPSIGLCNFQAQTNCGAMPLVWGEYCSYETQFINQRYADLVLVFEAIRHFYNDKLKVDGFTLKHTIVWEICYFYANDLKLIRQFHNVEGGCDKNRRAALIARLISNHRPIAIAEFQIPDNTAKQQDHILRMNEHYALHAMMHFLDLPQDLFKIDGFNKIRDDLLFIFSHRDPQPESLVCIARLLSHVAQEHAEAQAAKQREAELKVEIAVLRQQWDVQTTKRLTGNKVA